MNPFVMTDTYIEPKGCLFIFSAPSGSGKTTIVRNLMQRIPELAFSVSATTRPPRNGELEGIHYHFLSVKEFQTRIKNNDFVEYEQVYEGKYYGTLRSEVERIWAEGKHVVFDVDVQGGISLKRIFGEDALALFIQPPSLEALETRLRLRNTETEESLKQRLGKAGAEMQYADKFDQIVLNDQLEQALEDAESLIRSFIKKKCEPTLNVCV